MPPKSTKPAVATTNKRLHAIVTKPAAAPPALLKKRRTSLVRPDIVEVITPPKGFMDVAPTPHGPPSTMPPTPSFGATRFNQLPTPPEDSTMAPPAAGAKSAASYSSSGETSVSNRSTPSSPVKGEKQAGPPAAPSASSSSSSSSSNMKNSFRSWNVGTRYRLVRVLGKGSYGQPPSYATFNDLYLVFEFVDTDLHKLIMSPQYLTTRHIQVFLYQLLCALKYIHSANVIHRDMKPANILVNEDCTLKVDYGYAVDLWSLGCIFAELLSMQVESCSQYQ
ncbi:hypothetical protein DYB28_011134, partial [Aphanomyces astaci]